MSVVSLVVVLIRAFLLPRASIVAENLALRQQFAVLQLSVKRTSLPDYVRTQTAPLVRKPR